MVQRRHREEALSICPRFWNRHGAVRFANNSGHFIVGTSASLAGAWADVIECSLTTCAIVIAIANTTAVVVSGLSRAVKHIRALAHLRLYDGLIENEAHSTTQAHFWSVWFVCLEDDLMVVQSGRHPAISKTIEALGVH